MPTITRTYYYWSESSDVSGYQRVETSQDPSYDDQGYYYVGACNSSGVTARFYIGRYRSGSVVWQEFYARTYTSSNSASSTYVTISLNVSIPFDFKGGDRVAARIRVEGSSVDERFFVSNYEILSGRYWSDVRVVSLTYYQEWNGTNCLQIFFGRGRDGWGNQMDYAESRLTFTAKEWTPICKIWKGGRAYNVYGCSDCGSTLKLKTPAGVQGLLLVDSSASPLRIKTPVGVEGVYIE